MMNIVKKIEIIANSFETNKILEGLDQSGVHGHAVIHNVTGRGLRGEANEDLDMTMGENVYIIAFCMPDQLDPVVEHLKPILNKFGGTCYISDVMEIRSLRCVASV
jgi:nitrogen regulatory protein PII